tara:strand:- start:38 stop:850 length:813 start_codon:yes stop_codon:yes gene_type:complete
MSKIKNNYLLKRYDIDNDYIEIGIDEVGRGPLFGRVYAACVILPKKDNFKYEIIKDSKKFSSKKKMREVYDYLIKNLDYYSVSYVDEETIDKINILNASHLAMHNSINCLIEKYSNILDIDKTILMVDGNRFKPYCKFIDNNIKQIKHVTIEGGDNKYYNIAAASILAKVEHDEYIEDLCNKYPKLQEYYSLNNNKGYGTSKHIEGIKKYGISPWHRRSFSTCKNLSINPHNFYIVSNTDHQYNTTTTYKNGEEHEHEVEDEDEISIQNA